MELLNLSGNLVGSFDMLTIFSDVELGGYVYDSIFQSRGFLLITSASHISYHKKKRNICGTRSSVCMGIDLLAMICLVLILSMRFMKATRG